jgi:hypothetical protein
MELGTLFRLIEFIIMEFIVCPLFKNKMRMNLSGYPEEEMVL